MVLVDQQDAAYFYTEHKNLFIVTLAGKRYLINDSLEHLEETLPSADFFRINRQYIIHLKSIRDMFPESRSRVRVVLNPPAEEDLIVSTDRSPRFKQWLLGL
jgi:two-component system LytT family response regulator